MLERLSPVLIANRGEIAVRVARTAHALGLSTVGVVAPPDRGSLHADVVDAVVGISSYLDPDELLRAARVAGARSLHPGYGFLSENADFAEACAAAGITFIGPPRSRRRSSTPG
jgi:acetyl/propionyl-CoA carboxylase alpha subunit